jgi:hypothetical protein
LALEQLPTDGILAQLPVEATSDEPENVNGTVDDGDYIDANVLEQLEDMILSARTDAGEATETAAGEALGDDGEISISSSEDDDDAGDDGTHSHSIQSENHASQVVSDDEDDDDSHNDDIHIVLAFLFRGR